MLQRTKGLLSGLVADPPSAWLAVPVGFTLSVLARAAFGGDRSLVPFAIYMLAVTVAGVVSSRSVVAAEDLELTLIALVFGAIALGFVGLAVREVAGSGRPSIVLLVMALAAAMSNAVLSGYFVSLIIKFQRGIR